MAKPIVGELERFWAKTKRVGDCLIWTDVPSANGYATFSIRQESGEYKTVLAHRWIYQRTHGELPRRMDVMHSCDNRDRACVNLQHLSPGTRKRNMEDAVMKGRQKRGTMDPNAKLNDVKVRRVRALAASGHSQQAIAAHFGVHQVAISCVLRGKTWKHVK